MNISARVISTTSDTEFLCTLREENLFRHTTPIHNIYTCIRSATDITLYTAFYEIIELHLENIVSARSNFGFYIKKKILFVEIFEKKCDTIFGMLTFLRGIPSCIYKKKVKVIRFTGKNRWVKCYIANVKAYVLPLETENGCELIRMCGGMFVLHISLLFRMIMWMHDVCK